MVRERVDIDARVADYEVTTPPRRERLRLVWVRPPEVVEGDPPSEGTLAVLDAYRITCVPGHRAAS